MDAIEAGQEIALNFSEADKTPWFTRVKPVHVGWYECRLGERDFRVVARYWDGEYWLIIVPPRTPIRSAGQDWTWRGLEERP